MAIIANQILTNSNVDTITHTVDFGTYTATTSINNLLDRSLLNRYEFTLSANLSKTHTITIELLEPIQIDLVCIKDYSEVSAGPLVLKDGSDVSQTISNLVTSDSTRKVNGTTVRTTVYSFDNLTSIKKIEWVFTTQESMPVTDIDCFISGLFVSQSVKEMDIKPTSLNYKFNTQGTKIRTDGGQVYASKNNSYMTASFTTIATPETDVIEDYFEINYESSISEPLIFIPQVGEDIMLYGTQSKPNSTRCLLAKNGTDWLYETSFQIEEEL